MDLQDRRVPLTVERAGASDGLPLPEGCYSPDERSQVTPPIRAAEPPAIVEQALASHAVVEAQRRVAEFRKEDERVDAAFEEPPRRLRLRRAFPTVP
jgi:hypothetical protein